MELHIYRSENLWSINVGEEVWNGEEKQARDYVERYWHVYKTYNSGRSKKWEIVKSPRDIRKDQQSVFHDQSHEN